MEQQIAGLVRRQQERERHRQVLAAVEQVLARRQRLLVAGIWAAPVVTALLGVLLHNLGFIG